ncbi:hypothetical protein GCM10027059_25890 [Myceligenerans halotolerans]
MYRLINQRLMFADGPAAPAEPGSGGTPPKTDPPPSGAPAGDPPPAGGKPAGEGETGETDWQKRFEAQQQVSRDLEKKLKAAIPKDEAEKLRAQLATAQGKEAEYEAERERAAVLAEANAKANQRILKSEVRALAAGQLNDPNDALLYLDLSDIQVEDDGEVDRAVITERLEALAKSKPYLAAQGGTPPVFTSPTSAREGSEKPKQWTKADVEGATPQQIVDAKAAGLLDEYLSS